jgi:hypothetical protein
MNIIEQIDARFVSGNAVPVSRTHLTADEWQQIKAELAKVREYALEEAANECRKHKVMREKTGHARESSAARALEETIRALKDGE